MVPALRDGGGVSVSARFIYNGLVSSGRYDVGVISLTTSRHDADSVRLLAPGTWLRGIKTSTGDWDGVPFVHVGAGGVELEFRRYARRRALTAILQEYDLIQVVCGTPVWVLPAHVPGIPLFVSMATFAATERKSRQVSSRSIGGAWFDLMTRLTDRLDHVGARSADCVFVINHWTEDYLKRFIDPQKIVFATPGVDTEQFRPGRYNDHGYILSVGRFSDPRKNVRMLFEAYAQLLQARPHAPELVLAGRTLPGENDMAFAAKLGIVERIKMRENLSISELQEVYRGASLFVLSSDEEGLGIVILEVMSSGLPVVATRCGGPETVMEAGETGLLTPVGDPAALARAMDELLGDEGRRRKMAEGARKTAERSFSLIASFEPYLNRYDRLLYP